MAEIVELCDVRFTSNDCLYVEAVVADAVVTHQQSQIEPAEWGPAMCRGTMLFCDEDRIPATDLELIALFEERIDDWSPVDWSDD